ncbi:unnamed protein product [Didymodactylos carnosus]|uniref:Transcription initiation factor TFIID subunit 9 n=1 Tax=Didymodactylos carnosus TaxID=1234261 RepID=A0A814IT83_9BILA|nr:unnamed protein product [Didymodactylos carnosus]CAF1321728.1 unnamed protein product [Didymodactylos carnosus]CAF3798695.1 unnamed protein product [Didymodactylos carnosus]CAF4131886.1 unnamed protein product [Didymodactylos carnosus]
MSSGDHEQRLPKDGLIVQTMLQEMGITNYEPKLIPMVLDFMHKYTTDILEEAKLFSIHAGRKQVELDDIKLACHNWAEEHSTMPSKETLIELAKNKNRNPLPAIRNFVGPRLPPDRFCLLAPNYKLKDTEQNNHATNANGAAVLDNQQHRSVSSSFNASNVSLHSMNNATASNANFIASDLFPTKRKKVDEDDEDDDYDN